MGWERLQMNQENINRLKKAGRITGVVLLFVAKVMLKAMKAVGLFVVRTVAALGRYIIAILNTNAVAYPATAVATVLTIFVCFNWWWTGNIPFFDGQSFGPPSYYDVPRVQTGHQVQRSQQTQPQIPERLRKDKRTLWYASLAATDDMSEPNDRLAAAITNLNIALDNAVRIEKGDYVELVADTYPVFKQYKALAYPGQIFSWPRLEWYVLQFEANREDVEKTVGMLQAYLDNPAQFLAERPWLPKARSYNRTKQRPQPSVDPQRVRETNCLLAGTADKPPEFFRPMTSEEQAQRKCNPN